MNNKVIINNKIVFNDTYLSYLENVQKFIIEELKYQKFKKIYSDNLDILEISELYKNIYYKKDLDLIAVSFCNKELDARSNLINLFKSYNDILNDVTGIKLIEGYLIDENNFISGYFNKLDQFITCVKGNITFKNNMYISQIELKHEIVDLIEDYHFQHNIINPKIKVLTFGGVILEKNDPKTKQQVNAMKEIFDVQFADGIKGTKNQYQYLENEGYMFIFEFRKEGKMRIKCPSLDTYEDIYFLELPKLVEDKITQLYKKIKDISLKDNYRLVKEKTKTYCEECLKSIDSYLIPFNQRLSKKCYNQCDNIPFKNIIII